MGSPAKPIAGHFTVNGIVSFINKTTKKHPFMFDYYANMHRDDFILYMLYIFFNLFVYLFIYLFLNYSAFSQLLSS